MRSRRSGSGWPSGDIRVSGRRVTCKAPSAHVEGGSDRSAASPTAILKDTHSVERLYEKASNTGKTPRHEANHGSVHERFAARTQPLVIFAHPPLLVDPRQRTLHHPPPR
jgi:hypothetical protein